MWEGCGRGVWWGWWAWLCSPFTRRSAVAKARAKRAKTRKGGVKGIESEAAATSLALQAPESSFSASDIVDYVVTRLSEVECCVSVGRRWL